MKWWFEQWNDETLEGLSKSVKHTKLPSALACDEINIHVEKGEYEANVLMIINVVTTCYEANVKDERNIKWA